MHYYNEHDRFAAAWLRELIADGQIPKGEVDERSIVDVQPGDLAGFVQCHFFAGIGGWPYALRLAGWPEDRPVWTGSCPCQPFSQAGKQKGLADERHLWPHFFRLIEACRPPVIFGEQVASSSVIGKRRNKKVQDVLDEQAVLRVLHQFDGILPGELQNMREHTSQSIQKEQLQKQAYSEAWIDSCVCGAIPSKTLRATLRLGCCEDSSKNRQGILRIDGYSVRSQYSEGVELAIVGSNNSRIRVYDGECEGCALCGQRNGSQLGSKPHSRNSGSDHETTKSQIERLIAQIGRNPKEETSVWFDGISADMERIGYSCGASIIPACSLNAPHIRQRLYWVADTDQPHCDGWTQSGQQSVCDKDRKYSGVANSEASERRRENGANESGRRTEEAGRSGVVGRVGNAVRNRAERTRGAECESVPASQTVGLGESDGTRSFKGCCTIETPRYRHTAEPTGSTCRMGLSESEQMGRIGQSRQDGFWDDYDLIPCADGKVRRVESKYVAVVDGVPDSMVYYCDTGASHDEEKEAILNANQDFDKDGGNLLRVVREEVGQTSCSSQRPQSNKQHIVQLADIVRLLPSSLAFAELHGDSATTKALFIVQQTLIQKGLLLHTFKQIQTEWESLSREERQWVWNQIALTNIVKTIEHPLATAEARQMRLRGYGNAIVPQVAAEFIQAYMECERRSREERR